jgi:hypothetical protein
VPDGPAAVQGLSLHLTADLDDPLPILAERIIRELRFALARSS